MIVSLADDRFPLRLLRVLVVCAALAVSAGCEPKGASGTLRSQAPKPGKRAEKSEIRAVALASDSLKAIPALADPRNDRATLDWAMSRLKRGRWNEGYAELVEVAALAPRISWHGASIRAAGEGIWRGERLEGFDALVGDLLGATLVDAQDELWTAWRELDRAGNPESARKWLSEPPPWPPASIEKYLRREGENSMALIETLASELAPTAAIRAWLVRSWLSPSRPVDDSLLSELARAADGRLCAEPRLRAWLRAEWTASARQRYRRVSRMVGNSQPQSASAEKSRSSP
jgi:hypothetical protein